MITTEARKPTLEVQRASLRERLERIHADRTRAHGALEADFAEQAIQRENDEVLDSLEQSTRFALNQVEHALQHLERGLGDQCEICGAPIDSRRLAAVPHATRCTVCAGKQASID